MFVSLLEPLSPNQSFIARTYSKDPVIGGNFLKMVLYNEERHNASYTDQKQHCEMIFLYPKRYDIKPL